MDEVIRHWCIFRALVLPRPLMFVLLALFYVVGFLVAALIDAEDRWKAVLMLSAFPTAGIFALTTERLVQHAGSATELGIPEHALRVKTVQLSVVAVFVGIPWLYTVLFGGPLLVSASVLFFIAAFGTVVATRAYVVTFAALAGFGLNAVYPDFQWFFLPAVQIAALLAALYFLYHWRSLADPSPAARAPKLADITHEASDETFARAFNAKPEAVARYESTLDRLTDEVIEGIGDSRITDHAIGLGMGFNTRFNARAVLAGTAIALGAVAVWHFLHGHRPESAAYFVVCGVGAQILLMRIGLFDKTWRATHAEQSLLMLAPRWLPRNRVKWQLIRILARTQIGAWLTWSVVSTTALSAGWIAGNAVALGGIILLAATCASNATQWALFARRSLSERHASTIAILLAGAVGVGTFAVSSGPSRSAAVFALTMILLPAAISLAAVAIRPLQYPVNRRVRSGD